MKLILFLISTLLITSCAQQTEKSPLKVTFGAATAGFSGNLIVFGSNNLGHSFVKEVKTADDKLTINLNNGIWKFGAIGWEGANNFEGDSFCDAIGPFNLSGNQKIINLVTTKVKCSNPIFGGHANAAGLLPLKFNSCLNIKNYLLTEGPAAAPANLICDGSMGQLDGGAKSIKISLVTGDFAPNGSTLNIGNISSQCFPVSSSQAVTGVKLPFGSNALSLRYVVKTYSALGCASTDLVDSYIYRKSFTQISQGQIGGATPDTGSINVSLHADACIGNHLSNTPFAAGSTAINSYIICTKTQFENIAKAVNATCPGTTSGLPPMGCEEDANYQLGKDINFAGSNQTISNTFTGELNGSGFTLSNGNDPLFSTINNHATNDVRIHDIKINNFTIADAVNTSNFNYGILARNVDLTTTYKRIEIDRITIENSSLTIAGGNAEYAIGGLIGSANFSGSTGTDDSLFIRLVNSFADITSTDTVANVGGLVGITDGGTSKKIVFEINHVGVLPGGSGNTDQILISATGRAGGFIGKSTSTNIRHSNVAIAQITGTQKVGGFIGEAFKDTISNSYAELTFVPTGNSTYIGGAVGVVTNDKELTIEGVNTSLTSSGSADLVDKLGGLVGGYATTTAAKLNIRNSKANINTELDGSFHGGLVGSYITNHATPMDNIVNSVASGVIGINSQSANNNNRGGFIGDADRVEIKRSITDIDVHGYNNISGGIGRALSFVKLNEIYIFSNIYNEAISGSNNAGGAIGEVQAGINAVTIVGSFVDAGFFGFTICQSSTTDNCAAAIGTSANSNTNITDSIILGYSDSETAYFDHAIPDYIEGSSSLNITSSTITNIDNDTSCRDKSTSLTSLSGKFVYINGKCKLNFENKWFNFGYDSTNSVYLAGNYVEPFPISNYSQWNSIGDDSLLVSKTFKLLADIDFLDQTYIPIGTNNSAQSDNIFRGSIIPNGKKLKNITYTTDTSGSPTSGGIFPLVQGSAIGSQNDPLYIENLNLTASVANSGVVGEASNSEISIIVQNGTITGSVAGSVGGIVGFASSNVRLQSSAFNGTIDVPTGVNVGGLIGSLMSAMNGISIEESYVNLNSLRGATNVGGLIGNSSSSSGFKIKDSYARLGYIQAVAGVNDPLAGLIGQAGASVEITNSFVDLGITGALQAGFRTVGIGSTGHTISNVGVIGTSYSDDGNFPPTAVQATNSGLWNHVSISYDDSEFIIHSDNLIHLDWEIYGHNQD